MSDHYPAKGLCNLFGRTTEFNIFIYLTIIIAILIFGAMWAYGLTRDVKELKDKWTEKAYTSLVVSTIIIALLWTANMIYYEVVFEKKCGAVEQLLNESIVNVKSRLKPENIATNLAQQTSRVVADTFAKEFSSQLKNQLTGVVGNAIKSYLTK